MKDIKLLYMLLFISVSAYSQNPEWIYFSSNSIANIAMEENYFWFPSYNPNGVVRIDRTTWEKHTYQTNNSGLPSNNVMFVAVDMNGNKWIGHSDKGITKFDGINWTNYNTSNSGVPADNVSHIAFDNEGNVWFSCNGITKFDGTNWNNYSSTNSGLPEDWLFFVDVDSSNNVWADTYNYGAVKFDGITWTVYNETNSGMPYNWVYSIAFEDSITWFGTYAGGLAKFDGTNCEVFNTSNSGLPHDSVLCLAIDKNGNKWMGTDGGLVKFNESEWTILNTANSGLPNDQVFGIEIDENQNKIIGTFAGLAIYNEGGIVSADEEENNILYDYSLSQNYPNPFNPVTRIKYNVSRREFITMKVFDVLGKEITILVSEEKEPGIYEVEFQSSAGNKQLASGIFYYQLKAGNFIKTKKMILIK